jgi:hypothetical protein
LVTPSPSGERITFADGLAQQRPRRAGDDQLPAPEQLRRALCAERIRAPSPIGACAVADFAPQIFTSDAKGAGPQTSPTTWLPSAISGGKPALELNLETIEIHEVRSVDVTTDPHKVFQHR